ncbi:MAG: hypothetical protein HC839_04875 [Leptolyngbyaceae cyanobacterium RM2_2_21]|nr:hypothetical protein [Leptolyngbyaceae cyanobacterium RM2_2_21]
MANAESFYEWLTQYPPTLTYRRTRSGFGVLSRHTDGFAPQDFPVWVENAAIAYFSQTCFPPPNICQPSIFACNRDAIDS